MLITQGEEKKLHNETIADQVLLYTTAVWEETWLLYKYDKKKKKDKRELLTSEEKYTTSTNSWILNEISSK